MNRDDLLPRLRPLALEAFFLGTYLACRSFVDAAGHMPVWLAVTFLVAIGTETVAVYVKLLAVRHRLGDASLSPLPGTQVQLIVFSVLRVAVLSAMAIQATAAVTGQPQSGFVLNLLIALVVAKEVVVLAVLMRGKRDASVPSELPPGLEFAADLNLVFVSVLPALLLTDLFSGPMLDTAWNPIFLVVMVVACLVLFFVLVQPFRIFAAFRSAEAPNQPDAGRIGSATGLLTSLVVMITFVAPLFYDSAEEEEHMARALAARPDASEFVYSQTSRLKPSALKRLCGLSSLSRLELHTRHTGWLPPCVYGIPGLTELDLRGNHFTMLELGKADGLVTLIASHNEIAHLYDLNPGEASTVRVLDLSHNLLTELDGAIISFPNLVELDVSHNPLRVLSPDLIQLRQLRVLRLAGTDVSTGQVRAWRQAMPWTRFEL